ncbi:Rhomboid-related protein 2 [Bagarius yarrelli]|uniref:Rhomboid-related protein 2 n=1 Tax=Bagarius yarrelli TaxID=175774 RepID=A0A556U6G1_BAGYA|nr:Rhomboid-related protein 2 [Bagarius yarrelli]
MACGATLKRSMEFEALLGPQSPKRRRCSPLAGAAATPSPQRCSLRPQTESPANPPGSPQALSGEHRLTPEQIFQNIRQEYTRYQRRRQLEGAFNQTETGTAAETSNPSSPSGASSSLKKDQPTFTLRQVSYLCERLLKDHEEKIREEYEQILNTKLAEQYESFVKFTQDQIMRRYGARPASCWRSRREMAAEDVEASQAFPVERDGVDEEEEESPQVLGCCQKFHMAVSRWMLPEDLRETYLERANCCPPPIFIILVSLGELAVFIYYAVWKPQKQWITLDDGIWNSPLTYRPDEREEAWRFLSYMFVHAGVQHILGNLILQLLLGIPLELVHKGFEVGMVYLGGVLAGSLASSIFDPYSALVGASGGVYALIGGYFMNAVVNFREMIPLLGIFRITVILLIVGTDVGFALYRRFLSDAAGLRVSFVAHIGGGIAGMTIGYVFFSSYNQKLLRDPRFWLCIVGYITFLLFAVFFNLFLSPAPR